MRPIPQFVLYFAVCAAHFHPSTASAEEPSRLTTAQVTRAYFVGNSVTDTVKYGLFAELAAARGKELQWGRHMIPGAPLSFILKAAREGSTSGFTEKPYGNCLEALQNYEWDVVSLQPFDRRLVEEGDQKGTPDGDVAAIQALIDLARSNNPDVQILIYARWPRITVAGQGVSFDKDAYDKNVTGVSPLASGDGKGDTQNLDDFALAWHTPYTGGWGMQLEGKDYFEKLLMALRESNPDMKKPVRMVPVGYVMDELNTMMKAGQVSGYKDIHGVYHDGIHLDNVGSYVVACTFFATMFGESPVGLPAEKYEVRDPQLARLIEETVWRVVQEHPYAGVDNPRQEKLKP